MYNCPDIKMYLWMFLEYQNGGCTKKQPPAGGFMYKYVAFKSGGIVKSTSFLRASFRSCRRIQSRIRSKKCCINALIIRWVACLYLSERTGLGLDTFGSAKRFLH